jgi:hypothetical protein
LSFAFMFQLLKTNAQAAGNAILGLLAAMSVDRIERGGKGPSVRQTRQ